jgi:general secretion pathway protein I
LSQAPKAEAGADGRDGFSLLEALAALTILAICLVPLAELTHQTVRSANFAKRRVELIGTARKAIAALPARGALAVGETEGELNGERWRVVVAPYDGPALGTAAWEPELVRLEVRNAGGDRIEVDSVRLRPRGGR